MPARKPTKPNPGGSFVCPISTGQTSHQKESRASDINCPDKHSKNYGPSKGQDNTDAGNYFPDEPIEPSGPNGGTQQNIPEPSLADAVALTELGRHTRASYRGCGSITSGSRCAAGGHSTTVMEGAVRQRIRLGIGR